MPARRMGLRSFVWLGWGLGLLALGLACANLSAWVQGFVAGLSPAGTPFPTASPRPTRTPFRLPPTFTPRPSPTRPAAPPTPTPEASGTLAPSVTPSAPARATATPRISPTPTAYPGGTRWAFEGWCADGAAGPCLYASGFTTREGRRVVRYVFEHIPYPDLLEVRINGVTLECIGLAEYPTRAYCFGQVPPTLPVTLDMAWRTPEGDRVEVYVDPAVVQDLWQRERLPLGP